jgi:hypothetical protein
MYLKSMSQSDLKRSQKEIVFRHLVGAQSIGTTTCCTLFAVNCQLFQTPSTKIIFAFAAVCRSAFAGA